MRLFKNHSTAEQVALEYDLSNKSVLITGCNSGLGYETMRVLALRGAKIFALASSTAKAKKACASVKGNVIPLPCDLTCLTSIKHAINAIKQPLDIIIANAGIMALPKKVLVHGFEKHMFVNHIGHALLINHFKKQLTAHGRIIIVSSGAHNFAKGVGIDFNDLNWTKPYKPWLAYGQSKLANILFTKALSRRLKKNQTAVCLHPGIINTPLWRYVEDEKNYNYQTVHQGAATTVYLAITEKIQTYNGEYLSNGSLGKPSKLAQDFELSEKLWGVTRQFDQETFSRID